MHPFAEVSVYQSNKSRPRGVIEIPSICAAFQHFTSFKAAFLGHLGKKKPPRPAKVEEALVGSGLDHHVDRLPSIGSHLLVGSGSPLLCRAL